MDHEFSKKLLEGSCALLTPVFISFELMSHEYMTNATDWGDLSRSTGSKLSEVKSLSFPSVIDASIRTDSYLQLSDE